MITYADIERAADRLAGVSVHTPLIGNNALDEFAGGQVLIKPEMLQVTGSFKIRGAYNCMSQLNSRQREAGVVAWSSGNHAQGVAAAGAMLDIATTIVMPDDAPQAKRRNTERLGGKVVEYDRYSGDREAIARELAAQTGAALVPSFDHHDVIAGQGTVGLEIARDLADAGLQPDQVLIPCGGGGLSSGSALALTTRFPGVDVWAVEPQEFDDTARSFDAGSRVTVAASARSICDALQTPMPGKLTFELNRRLLRGVVTVTDEQVRDAMRFALQHLKMVVEPGGAVALAAVLNRKVATDDRLTVVVLSGGNVDFELYSAIQRGA